MELPFEWTAPPQEHIERLDQRMTSNCRTRRSGVMVADTLHLLATHLVTDAVIANQVSSHDGSLRAASTLGTSRTIVGETLSHRGTKSKVKAFSPPSSQISGSPGCLGQKAAKASQRRLDRDRTQQSTQRSLALAEQQAQQHGNFVLILQTTEAVRERLGILAQPLVCAYNRDSHDQGFAPVCVKAM
jgi:hypothetical protein